MGQHHRPVAGRHRADDLIVLTNEVRIVIPGHPAPKGSLKCIGGRGGRGHVLIEDNTRTKDWRHTVAMWVRNKWPTHQHADQGQPVGAEITFTLPRPKGHYRTGKNAHLLRDTAPLHPVGHSTGDVDKLLRLALDALQDTDVLPDDCAVVETSARKAYPRPVTAPDQLDDVLGYPGIAIRLYPI